MRVVGMLERGGGLTKRVHVLYLTMRSGVILNGVIPNSVIQALRMACAGIRGSGPMGEALL